MLEQISYRGWNNAYKLSNGTIELIVLADVGPRIIWYGFSGGENQLYEVEADAGQIGGIDFRLYGGHRLWVSPEVERTYVPDNQPVKVSGQDNKIRLTAPVESAPPGTSLQKELELEMASSGSQVTIAHRVTNHSHSPTLLAPWAPTMLRPSGTAIFPLPRKAPMDKDHYQSVGILAMWSFTDMADPRWIFGTEYLQLKQLTEPTGRFKEQMGGIYNQAGWGAYYRDGNVFVKRAPVIAGAQYPDFGCNFEVFTNPDFLELETLGPLQELQPLETATHSEQWWLHANVPGGMDDEWIRSTIVPLTMGRHIRSALHQLPEFGFGNCKFREAAIQTDQKFWIDPHDGLLQTIESGEMNSNFPVENTLISRLARLARHSRTLPNIRLALSLIGCQSGKG